MKLLQILNNIQTDKDILFAIIISALAFSVLAASVMGIIVFAYQKQKKLHLEKEALKKHFEQVLQQSRIEIQEQSFLNISQELHDNVGQLLTLAKINLIQIEKEIQHPKLLETREIISTSLYEIRTLSKVLHKENILKVGFLEALGQQVDLWNKSGLIKIDLNTRYMATEINPKTGIIIFRMIQECFTNILKHAKATEAIIELLQENNCFRILIQDNGKGFDMNNVNTSIGLKSLYHRAAVLNGNINFEANPSNGTKIEINIPINHPIYD